MKTALAALTFFALAPVAAAQAPVGSPHAAGVTKDPASLPAGHFVMDPRHTSVIARIGHHNGISFSSFRFGGSAGTLDWTPSDPDAIKLAATIDMTSIETPVPGFANELIGDRFLKTGTFHDATFVSTKVQRTGPATARISGNLTFMGQTKPAVIDAALVGGTTGPGARQMGFTGTLRFKRSDFGFTAMTGPIGDDVEIQIDAEFDQAK